MSTKTAIRVSAGTAPYLEPLLGTAALADGKISDEELSDSIADLTPDSHWGIVRTKQTIDEPFAQRLLGRAILAFGPKVIAPEPVLRAALNQLCTEALAEADSGVMYSVTARALSEAYRAADRLAKNGSSADVARRDAIGKRLIVLVDGADDGAPDLLKVLRAEKLPELEIARFLAGKDAVDAAPEETTKLFASLRGLGLDPRAGIAQWFSTSDDGSLRYTIDGQAAGRIAEKVAKRPSLRAEVTALLQATARDGLSAFGATENALAWLDRSAPTDPARRRVLLDGLLAFIAKATPLQVEHVVRRLDEDWLGDAALSYFDFVLTQTHREALHSYARVVEAFTTQKHGDVAAAVAWHDAFYKLTAKHEPLQELGLRGLYRSSPAEVLATVQGVIKTPLSPLGFELFDGFKYREVPFADGAAYARALAGSVTRETAYTATGVIEQIVASKTPPATVVPQMRAILGLAPKQTVDVYALLEMLGVDPTPLTHKNVAQAVLDAWAKVPADKRDYQKLAIGIDALHEGEGDRSHTDAARAQIVAGLGIGDIYRLSAGARRDSFTSTFKLLEARLTDAVTADPALLTKLDPKGEHLQALAMTLCSFQSDALILALEAQMAPALTALYVAAGAETQAPITGSLIHLMKNGSAMGRAIIEAALLDKIEKGKGDEVAAMVFVLKRALAIGAPLSTKAAAAIAKFPAPASVEAPLKTWLADRMISAQLFFYPDETALEATGAALLKTGYRPRYEAGLSSKLTQIYQRTLANGITQRVVISKDTKLDRQAPMDSKVIDIVGHRGHSFHFKETFPGRAGMAAAMVKLLLGGSCGSFRSMTEAEFLDAYGANIFVADIDTGEGWVNDAVLVRVMDALARGEGAFEKMGLDDYVKKRGIRLPSEPAMQLLQYLSVVRVGQAAK
ncbi:MAG: hypothetical protein IT381_31355 [Deltaproteobacteria bacterium]|nr:hypothetical protein [Deltaproteobacteria bacterium]